MVALNELQKAITVLGCLRTLLLRDLESASRHELEQQGIPHCSQERPEHLHMVI